MLESFNILLYSTHNNWELSIENYRRWENPVVKRDDLDSGNKEIIYFKNNSYIFNYEVFDDDLSLNTRVCVNYHNKTISEWTWISLAELSFGTNFSRHAYSSIVLIFEFQTGYPVF